MATTTSVGSRYGPNELAEIDKARGSVYRSTFQKQAALEKARRGKIETWADHMGVNPGPLPSTLALSKIASLGLGWVSISPERGWMGFGEMAALVTKCHDAGLKVLATAQESSHDYTQVVATPGPFADYALALADAGAEAVAIGNEWNNPVFYKSPDSTMYGPAKIASACLARIQMNHPSVPVYMPSWSPMGGTLAPVNCQRELGKRLAQMGTAASLFAGSSHHPYSFNGPLEFGMPQHEDWNACQQTPKVYNEAKQSGCGGGMALSEYGCPSAGTQAEWPHQVFSEEWQAKIIAEYFTAFDQFRRVWPMPIAYMGLSTAIDGDATTRPIEGSMGMFRADGSEKAAAQVVRLQAKKVW